MLHYDNGFCNTTSICVSLFSHIHCDNGNIITGSLFVDISRLMPLYVDELAYCYKKYEQRMMEYEKFSTKDQERLIHEKKMFSCE